jgi:hypothetical protein
MRPRALSKVRANIRIAGSYTVGDWVGMRATLTANEVLPELWHQAFAKCFKERLETRYFAPINAIRGIKCDVGEGFAIVAIQCSLIEFLGAALQGRAYIDPGELERQGRDLTELEYSSSMDIFVEFLTTAPPFDRVFNKRWAQSFYSNVRCGLLHEARTKGRWLIRASSSGTGAFIDIQRRIIYRDELDTAFRSFVEWYRSELPTREAYQGAFVRTFDHLSTDDTH